MSAVVIELEEARHRIATRESNLAALRQWAMREQGRMLRRLPDLERAERMRRLDEHEEYVAGVRERWAM